MSSKNNIKIIKKNLFIFKNSFLKKKNLIILCILHLLKLALNRPKVYYELQKSIYLPKKICYSLKIYKKFNFIKNYKIIKKNKLVRCH